MRIYIITLHRAENYGSVLQTLAFQLKLEQLGHEVTILDYYPYRFTNKGLLERLKGKSSMLKNPLLLFVAKCVIYPSYIRKNIIFSSFLSRYINLSSRSFSTNQEALGLFDDADVYCTGSDQVWNSYWNEGIEKALYLDFVPKNKLVFSYASSIGLSELPENEINETKCLLDKYEYLSVREDSGVSILRKLGRLDVVQSLDPTLLLTMEEWNCYADSTANGKSYVLTYNLHHDQEIDKYADALSKKYNLPIYNISYNWHDVTRKGHLCWCPSVERFLSLIKNASYVIADSFHATVFSIIFERPFVCITPNIASSRISSILNLLGLSERNLSAFQDISVIEKTIDYSAVKKLLENERVKSIDYLRMVLNSSSFTHNKK